MVKTKMDSPVIFTLGFLFGMFVMYYILDIMDFATTIGVVIFCVVMMWLIYFFDLSSRPKRKRGE